MAHPPEIRPKMQAEQAFQTIARQCVERFSRQLPALRQNWDAEALHQARVGLRQLLAAFSLFRPIIGDGAFPALRGRVKETARMLGETRNLDVVLAAARQPALPTLQGTVSVMRSRSYADVVHRLEGAASRDLAGDLLDWIEHGAWRTRHGDLRHQSLRRFAGRRLERMWRKFRKRSRHIESLAPRSRHKVRIAAKKLRYDLEFMAPLAKSAKARRRRTRLVETMKRLQDALGALNDLPSLRRLAPGFARKGRAAAFEAGRFLGAEEARARPLLRQAGKAARGLRRKKPFWR